MDLDKLKVKRNILCIDLKSFYASCECVMRGLDPYNTPLVVADRSRGGGSVVLAVTPYLKKKGIKSRGRVFELPNDKTIIYAKPQMKRYLEISAEIISIYLDYVDESDMHIYSIDEVFLDVTDYLKCHKKNDYELAELILKEIQLKTGVPATCGIGPNMLIAKLALDIESKHVPSNIAKWGYDDIPEKLWPVSPLSDMWGIGRRMEIRLNRMGFNKVGDIALCDIDVLKKEFGIIGEELYFHTHGIDLARINQKMEISRSKSYGLGQVLFKDYNGENIKLIIREMVDEVCMRMRFAEKKGIVIHLGIGYSKTIGGGFSRQMKIGAPTNNSETVYDVCIKLFDKFYSGDVIRKVSVSISGLSDELDYQQLNLFEDNDKLERDRQLNRACDVLKHRFGKNSVLRASSYLEDSTSRFRNTLIGGHNSEKE